MKTNILHYFKIKNTGFLFLTLMIFNQCKEEAIVPPKSSEELVISEYVAKNTTFSEFNNLLVNTGLNNLLSIRGPYTLMLPNDSAMKVYYKKKNINSFLDLDTSARKELVYYHLVPSEIQTSDFQLGALREKNAMGDFLVTEFKGSDIYVNKVSKIIKRNIRAANGLIHLIDKVIEPVTENVYDILAKDPSYSIFTKGLELTGLKDTLQLVQFPFGSKMARTRYTIFAIADTVYNRYGINSVNDLINKYTNSPDSIKYLENGFYRYMEYHCLGGTYYLSDFTTKIYPILSSDNNLLVTVDLDYKINFNKVENTYTSFYIDQSNIPAKNGAIHAINNLLPVELPEPTKIEFEVTDYFDLKQGDYYGKYYKKWYDGKNTFAKIKWEGDYLQYYYKDPAKSQPNKNWDCLNMTGFWWIEITTPKIMKGSYSLSGFIWANSVDYAIYVDGVQTGISKRTDSGNPKMGDFTWTKTEEHKIKLVALSSGMLFWDTITLTPIK